MREFINQYGYQDSSNILERIVIALCSFLFVVLLYGYLRRAKVRDFFSLVIEEKSEIGSINDTNRRA